MQQLHLEVGAAPRYDGSPPYDGELGDEASPHCSDDNVGTTPKVLGVRAPRSLTLAIQSRCPRLAVCCETNCARTLCSTSATIIVAIALALLLSGLGVAAAIKASWNNKKTLLATFLWLPFGLFVLITVPLSAYDMVKHLQNYDRPLIQRYVVRILWMVPIYSAESWLSLFCSSSSLFANDGTKQATLTLCIQTLRELYEAFVIYSFFHFIVACLGSEEEVLELLTSKSIEKGKLILAPGVPCCWPRPLPLCMRGCFRGVRGEGVCCAGTRCKRTVCQRAPVAALYCALPNPLLTSCKLGVLQYAISRTLTTLITFVSSFIPAACVGKYPWSALPVIEQFFNGSTTWVPLDLESKCNLFASNSYNLLRANGWVALINNISQMWAIYCLVLLYHAVHEDLHKWKPLPKFLVIKAVVFFSYWQSLLIGAFFAFVVQEDWLQKSCNSESLVCITDKDTMQDVVCDGLIVAEMLIYALAHHWIFSWKQFRIKKEGRQKLFFEAAIDPNVYRSLVDSALPTDMVGEIADVSKTAIDEAAHEANKAGELITTIANDTSRQISRAVDDTAMQISNAAESAADAIEIAAGAMGLGNQSVSGRGSRATDADADSQLFEDDAFDGVANEGADISLEWNDAESGATHRRGSSVL